MVKLVNTFGLSPNAYGLSVRVRPDAPFDYKEGCVSGLNKHFAKVSTDNRFGSSNLPPSTKIRIVDLSNTIKIDLKYIDIILDGFSLSLDKNKFCNGVTYIKLNQSILRIGISCDSDIVPILERAYTLTPKRYENFEYYLFAAHGKTIEDLSV